MKLLSLFLLCTLPYEGLLNKKLTDPKKLLTATTLLLKLAFARYMSFCFCFSRHKFSANETRLFPYKDVYPCILKQLRERVFNQ